MKGGVYRMLTKKIVFKVFGSFLKKEPLAKNPTVTLLSEKYAMKFIGRMRNAASSWHSPHQRKTHP